MLPKYTKYRIKQVIDGHGYSTYYPQVNYWVITFGGTARECWKDMTPNGFETKEEALSYCTMCKGKSKTIYHNVEG